MGLFTDILKEIPTTGVLRERILLLQEKMNDCNEQVIDLKEENTQLKEDNRKLEEEIQKLRSQEDFEEHRGALFKRKPGGGYHLSVYCPLCHNSTFSLQGITPYSCQACKWYADFTGKQLTSIINKLPE